jgi:hypothetical protein
MTKGNEIEVAAKVRAIFAATRQKEVPIDE